MVHVMARNFIERNWASRKDVAKYIRDYEEAYKKVEGHWLVKPPKEVKKELLTMYRKKRVPAYSDILMFISRICRI
jgi:hypothetical protein